MSRIKLWAKAIRAYSYSASLVPVAIGGLVARQSGEGFSWVRFAVSLMAGVLVHTAANLWNDYFDFKGGVDTVDGGIGSGVLVHGNMSPARCFRGAVICALLAATGGLWLATQVGLGLIWLGILGMIGAIGYSAGPFSPKHRALGEVWVFLLMGVGMTLGGYMAQTGAFSWTAIAAGTPAALLMTLILYTNNLRDLRTDRSAGLKTLPMLFRPTAAKLIAILFLVVAYAMSALMAVTHQLPLATQASLLTLPLAVPWGLGVWKGPVEEKHVVNSAKLHMLFGVLFAAGFAFGG
jgi:1,4-dihydroxy-2-naphthoate polyprenyltransferase